MAIKTKYSPELGFHQVEGGPSETSAGLSLKPGESKNQILSLDVSRAVNFSTSQTVGVKELSGSLLALRGRAEGLFFHMGGNQYISNNAWYDAFDGSGKWKYQTQDSSAFRWGFRGSQGCFDLDFAVRSSTADQVTSGSTVPYFNMPQWGTGLSLTASNGAITIGKKADRSTVEFYPFETAPPHKRVYKYNGANAMLDVTGSMDIALAVTGSVELGCGAPDAYVKMPSVAVRPSSPQNGMMIYNTAESRFEVYQDGGWYHLGLTPI